MFVRGSSSVSVDGVEYTADSDGLVDVPPEAVGWLMRVHNLEVVPEWPVEKPVKKPAARKPAKS